MTRQWLSFVFVVVALSSIAISCTTTEEASPPEDPPYTADQVIELVDNWPSGWPGAGEVSTAIIDVCSGANTGGTDLVIQPFQATPLDTGRWTVTTACDYSTTDSGSSSLTFEWIFFEDGPRLEATGGRAADVTGQ